MATTPFTLAALATSAVPGLVVTGTRTHTMDGEGEFTAAVLTTETGDVIVRVPVSPAAEVKQSAELLSIAALAEGAGSARAKLAAVYIRRLLPQAAACLAEAKEGAAGLYALSDAELAV